jgi:hypothetical protein
LARHPRKNRGAPSFTFSSGLNQQTPKNFNHNELKVRGHRARVFRGLRGFFLKQATPSELPVKFSLQSGEVHSKVWFNTSRLAATQTMHRLQKFGIKPKNPLARGRVL